MKDGPGRSTIAVHAGLEREPGAPGAMTTPIYQSSTFDLTESAYRDIAESGGENAVWYTRLGNPTVAATARAIAELEGGDEALLFSSGMAATSTSLLATVPAGGRVVAADALYGDTHVLLGRLAEERGCEVEYVPVQDLTRWNAALSEGADVVFVESLSNPMLRVADLPGLAAAAHEAGALAVVDSTFATPVNLRPLEHGFDLVLHSATKYLNGHSDLLAGTAVGSEALLQSIRRRAWNDGGCLDPHSAFLLRRGLRTLELRMERHNANALEIARWLEAHPEVEAVSYPLLDSHPDRDLAGRLLGGGSGIVTVRLRGGDGRALRFLRELRLIHEAASLGGVESLACAPHNTSHLALSPAERERAGILPGTVRLSLGIEDVDDLLEDVDHALSASSQSRSAEGIRNGD
jgi:cystathionine beta-lyase/cystathionine gamma-synthase